MLNASFPRVAAAWLLAALSTVQAAPRKVETFDAQAWQRLQADTRQPAAVVFTTTDCAHCPAVIEQLAAHIRRHRPTAELIAVVMDAAPGDADATLLSDSHYRPADRLFAFAGQAAALRFGVNPAWRGVTPYVGLLKPQGAPVWVTGRPSAADLAAWP
ncbi:hypothetical protein [Piscinibacter sp. XHJ-5]|uniref:hypothetical protein n=1 Tax=Piscinibacter sp. XHJ-5 TaxID=3037797 RepID=UPI002452F1E8|nr:hypothetical protein [Piscinibacter sp. XHJ-5]